MERIEITRLTKGTKYGKHLINISKKKINKGFVMVTDRDYSLPGSKQEGFYNIIILHHVKNDEEAIEKAKGIARGKYEKTNMGHEFYLLKNGRVISNIISPDCNDPHNSPICRICYEKGEKRIARFVEDFGGTIEYSCRVHQVKNELIKRFAAVMTVRIFDLGEEKEIFSNCQ